MNHMFSSHSFQISYFRRKLLPMLCLVIASFLILSTVICSIVEQSIQDKFDDNSIALLSQTSRSFDSVISEIYALTLILTYDTSTVKTIQNCLNSTNIHYSDIDNIRTSFVIPLIATRDYIDSIYIYFDNPNGFFIANTEGLMSVDTYFDSGWFASVMSPESKDRRIWSEVRSYNQYSDPLYARNVVTLYQRNLYQDGIVVLNLDQDYFNSQLDSMKSYEGQIIYVLDENGTLLFSTTGNNTLSAAEVNSMLSADSSSQWENTYFLSSAKTNSTPKWSFVSVVPKKSLYAPISQIRLLIFTTMIVACILTVIMTTLKVLESYKSLNRIIAFIEDLRKNPHTHTLGKKPKEYAFIVESLVEAYTREYALKQELLENKYTAKVLELKTLQSQINPHFLLNTLQSIFWASFQLTGSYNQVSKMIEDLNAILGYLLESETILVPIEKEVRHLESYVSIQQMKSRHKFEMQWDVPDNLRSYYTGKLLFQPFLENAILHGFQGDGSWVLRFKIRRREDHLLVSITDNGVGIPREQLIRLQKKILDSTELPSSHIGICNSNRRLRLLFGPQYQISLQSKESWGTQIRLKLPLITDENLDEILKDVGERGYAS